MHRIATRLALTLALLLFAVGALALPGHNFLSRLMAAGSAETSSFLPAIFGLSGDAPSPTPQPGATATATATQGPTRPPKATDTPTPTVIGTHTPTPTATNTPIASSTPIGFGTTTPGFTPVAPTATPSPTPQTSQVIVLPNSSSYVDLSQTLHVIGEVKNNGATAVQFVNVKAVFYSRGGVELDDASVYAALNILLPGDKTCFDIRLPVPVGFGSYVFTDVSHVTSPPPPPSLALSNVQAALNPNTGFYSFAGKITNTGQITLEDVTAIAALYDAAGIVRGCQEVPIGLNEPVLLLPAGAAKPFQMDFTGRNNSDVTNYRLQADGSVPE